MIRKKGTPALGISKQWIDELLALYFRSRIRSLVPGEVTPWRHHWETTLLWNEEREMWTAKVEPGFCESKGGDPRPHFSMEARHAPEVTRKRLELSIDSRERVDVPLTEGPEIDLPEDLWRPVGTEAVGTPGLPAEAVPQAYLNLGVAPAKELRSSEDGGVVQVIEGDLEERGRARLLRAMDIVLSHERSRTSPKFNLEPGGVVSVVMDIDPPSQPVKYARIHRRRKFEPKPDLGSLGHLVDPLVDDGVDEIHIATVYLMSEPGLLEGAPIDDKWIPDAKHNEFWPLQYRERYERDRIEPTRLAFDGLGIGLGTLDGLAERILEGKNQQIADLESQFNSAKAEGRFYSA